MAVEAQKILFFRLAMPWRPPPVDLTAHYQGWRGAWRNKSTLAS